MFEWNDRPESGPSPKDLPEEPRFGLLRLLPLLLIVTVAACSQAPEDAEDAEDEETSQEEASSPEDPTPEPQPAPEPEPEPEPAPEPEPEPEPEQAPPEPQPEPDPVAVIPQGTRMLFEVEEPLSTDTHSAGDEFVLRLVEDVQGVNGALIPAGATAQGVVTEAEESGGSDEEAILAVEVRSLHVNGQAREMATTIEGADVEAGARDSGTRSAAKVATGAAAGAIMGQILGGDTRSTTQGAAAGAAAGAGVAFMTRDGHAVLGEGSTLEVRLDEPFQVP